MLDARDGLRIQVRDIADKMPRYLFISPNQVSAISGNLTQGD
jgi:hypothetical protein